jgi:hypothetical protein
VYEAAEPVAAADVAVGCSFWLLVWLKWPQLERAMRVGCRNPIG